MVLFLYSIDVASADDKSPLISSCLISCVYSNPTVQHRINDEMQKHIDNDSDISITFEKGE